MNCYRVTNQVCQLGILPACNALSSDLLNIKVVCLVNVVFDRRQAITMTVDRHGAEHVNVVDIQKGAPFLHRPVLNETSRLSSAKMFV